MSHCSDGVRQDASHFRWGATGPRSVRRSVVLVRVPPQYHIHRIDDAKRYWRRHHLSASADEQRSLTERANTTTTAPWHTPVSVTVGAPCGYDSSTPIG